MGITQQQYFDKITKFVPSWWFTTYKYTPALFQAIAGVFSQISADCDDQQRETFITQANAPFLDLHGEERTKPRVVGELDPAYALRIQQITSQTDYADLLANINNVLLVKGAKILQPPKDKLYLSRGSFCSRDEYIDSFGLNYFIVVIPKQQHPHYTFVFNAEAPGFSPYANRGNFCGSNDSSSYVFANLINMINDQKAFGMMYSIVESTKTSAIV